MWKLESTDADPGMSCLQGYVRAHRDDLVRIFGEPNDGDGGYKVHQEWDLCLTDDSTEDSLVATIYDWKEDSPPDGYHQWHIGGMDSRAVMALDEYVKTTYPNVIFQTATFNW